MASKIFLDTTIQIERITATLARQAEIADILNDKHIVTSTYVLGEYLRTIVKDAGVLYGLVNTTEHMYDVETKIANIHSQRSASRCILLLAMLHRSGIYEREMILYQLRVYLRHGLVNRFVEGIDELTDITCCGLAKERPEFSGGTYQLRAQCTRRVKECELVALLTKRQPEIKMLAEGLKEYTDRSLVRLSRLCSLILENPDVARGRNCTWYLGDLIIALEAPADAPIYTTNHKHFEPICSLIGKEVYNAK